MIGDGTICPTMPLKVSIDALQANSNANLMWLLAKFLKHNWYQISQRDTNNACSEKELATPYLVLAVWHIVSGQQVVCMIHFYSVQKSYVYECTLA